MVVCLSLEAPRHFRSGPPPSLLSLASKLEPPTTFNDVSMGLEERHPRNNPTVTHFEILQMIFSSTDGQYIASFSINTTSTAIPTHAPIVAIPTLLIRHDRPGLDWRRPVPFIGCFFNLGRDWHNVVHGPCRRLPRTRSLEGNLVRLSDVEL